MRYDKNAQGQEPRTAQAPMPAPSKPAPPPGAESKTADTSRPTLTPLQATLELARRGNPACLDRLRAALDEHPALWQHYGDLGAVIERSWIGQIAKTDLLVTESVTRQLAALRSELGGANRLEKLIVERIVSAWLQVQHAEAGVADGEEEGLRLRQFRLRQLESAERRFQAASRNLALIRRLLGGVEMHVTHEHKVSMPTTQAAGLAATPAVPTDKSVGADGSRLGIAADRREALFGRLHDPILENSHV